MAGDDNDKTVFGQSLPNAAPKGTANRPPAAQPPAAAPMPPPQQPPHAAPPGADKTVFGVQLPPAGAPPPPTGGGRVAPTGAPPPPMAPAAPMQPHYQPPPNNDDTWLGGNLGGHGLPTPPPQQNYQQPPQQNYTPHYQPQHAYPTGTGADMFPDIPAAVAEQVQQVAPRIALEDALRGTGLGKGGSTNPLVAAAANLMILLGRLRTGLVEMQAAPLIDHVAREIDMFERNANDIGASPQDVSDAKYALSATADDIVQNLPGADKGIWLQYSMVARFFGERSAGVVFFQRMDDAMKAPGQRFNVLELMLTCLSLGFEGQYRVAPNGSVELAKIRNAIYETLRRVHPRPDDDISVHWMGVPLGGKRRTGGTPIWIVAAVAALMVVALFATLSTLISKQGGLVREGILALHTGLPELTIERTVPVREAYVAPSSQQLERIQEALATEIASGAVAVDAVNAFIFIRVGDVLQFRSGSADIKNGFSALAKRIAEVLNAENGPIRVVGHTDSIPVSGRGRYKTNEALSQGRAEAVRDVLGAMLTDPTRIEAIGRGAAEPIETNDTREGRAKNRRVEVMIAREGASE